MSPFFERIKHYLIENPLFHRFLKNSGYMFSSSSISMALVAVQAILAGRLLGAVQLGLITLVMSITSTVNQLFSFRMGEYVIRFYGKAKAENNRDQIFSVIRISAAIESTTSICAFVFIYFIAAILAKVFIKDFAISLSVQLLRLFGLTILFNLTTETANGVLRITNRFKIQAVLQLLQAIATFVIITLAFFFKWGFNEVLMGYFLGKIIIGTGPIVMAIKAMNDDYGRNWLFTRSKSRPSLSETFHFALSTNLSATVKTIASESWPMWLGLFLDEGSIGIFKVAMSVVNLLTIPITPLIPTAFPDITKSVVAKKWQELRKLLKQITLLAAAWTIPAGLVMAVIGKWLVWLYGKDFPASYGTLMILILGYASTNIYFWNRSLLLSFGKANIALYVLAAGAIIKVGLAFVVIPRFGANGEAALLSGYFILTTVDMVWIGYRMIRKSELKEISARGSMKIAYIATSSIPSSTANSIQVMKVCQALTLNGHETTLFIPGRGELDWNKLTVQYGLTTKFKINRIPSVKNLKRFDFILSALRQAKKLGVDVVYTRMLWVAGFAQMQKMPVLLELHDVPAGRFGKFLFKRYLGSKSKKRTVLITRALGDVIEKHFNVLIPPSESIVAPDGVDLERYAYLPDRVAARHELGLKENLTAVYTGGFYKGRGLELLLELAKSNPRVQFLWVGGKPEAVEVWNEVIQDQKIKNIILTGFIPNQKLPLYQAAADILLMPFGKTVSGSSGGNTADVCSPMKMFEYMAAGRAILTSDLPVLREVLNENNALFYAPEDVKDLKLKFSILVENEKKRESLAKRAKQDASQYSWQERMQKVLASF